MNDTTMNETAQLTEMGTNNNANGMIIRVTKQDVYVSLYCFKVQCLW